MLKNSQSRYWYIRMHNFGPQSGWNCLTGPKVFFRNFTGVIFINLLCPIMLQSLKIFFNVGPEIKGCIILGQNWNKLPIWCKRQFFWEFHLSDLCQFIVPYHSAKFEKKKSLRQILRYNCIILGLGQHCPFGTEDNFFLFFFFMKIYIQTKKYLRENSCNYENVTIALFCYQNDLNLNTTESWLKHNCH